MGFLTFVTYYLNVPLLEPWLDWLGWFFGVVVVVVIVLGQTRLVRHAGQSHNHAREDLVDGYRHEADRGFQKRNLYFAGTGVTAIVITGGMIWRGTATLGNASIGTTAVMIFAATVTGLLLPTLAYLGVALDGSTVSRERDGLAAALDDDFDGCLQIVSDCRQDLAGVDEIGEALRNKTFPDICHETREVLDGVYEFYATVRLLIGGLSADPPTKTTKTISVSPAGSYSGYIGTSIPGAGTINLDSQQVVVDAKHATVLKHKYALGCPATPAAALPGDPAPRADLRTSACLGSQSPRPACAAVGPHCGRPRTADAPSPAPPHSG